MDQLLPLPELPAPDRRAGLGLCRFRDGEGEFHARAPAYFVASPGVRRGFCAQCGSTLTYEGEVVHEHLAEGDLVELGFNSLSFNAGSSSTTRDGPAA